MTTQTPAPAPTGSPRRRWLIGVGIGVAVIALAAVVYTVFSPAPASTAAGRGAASGPAPVSLTATSASGRQVTVPGGGKPSLLFFFSASCGTCGPAAHAVAQAQQANPQGANYVAVDMDPAETPATITAFLRTNQASDLAVTSDHGGALTSTYGVTQLSTAVTLNPSGQVVTRAVEPQTAQIQAGLAQARTPVTGLLVLAFGARLLAPINPCGFGLLPAMLTATLNPTGDTATPARRVLVPRLAAGLRTGLALTLGFTATFTVIGLGLTAGLRSLITLVPWLAAALGIVLALIGLALLTGRHLPLRLPTRARGLPEPAARGAGRVVAFGAGYAIASASCTLAVLLAVVTQAAATSLPGVLAVFTAYAAGSALLLITLAVLAAATSTVLARHLQLLARYASRITGALLAASGAYLLYYWLPPLLGAGRPGDGGLARLAGHAATAITDHQLTVVLAAILVIAATTLAAAHTRHRTGTTDIGADTPEKPVTPEKPDTPEQPDTTRPAARRG